MRELFESAIRSQKRLLEQLGGSASSLERMVRSIAEGLRARRTLFVCGNGGSAAQAQHLAAELVVRFQSERAPLSAIALNADTSLLTACANDLGYEAVFSRQIEALAKAGDLLLILSTSGRSPNLLRAAESARSRGLRVFAFLGRDGGVLLDRCDEAVVVPSDDVARIQEAHLLLLHILCQGLEKELAVPPE